MDSAKEKALGDIVIGVIDDDITSLDLVSFLIEKKGFAVRRFADGGAALLESLQGKLPNLFLVDLMMPGINGIETVRRMRKMGIDKVPIIAFTALDDAEIHQDAIDAGCNLVLTKPCPPDRLLRHINNFLNK